MTLPFPVVRRVLVVFTMPYGRTARNIETARRYIIAGIRVAHSTLPSLI